MRIGVVGYGFVGKALGTFFRRAHEVFTYDKILDNHRSTQHKTDIESCDLVFVSVPTLATEDGRCDTSAVEEVVKWVKSPICIKSTVVPGTVDRLSASEGPRIVFSPEYVGEAPSHPWPREEACGFLIVGGPSEIAELVITAYRQSATNLLCYRTDALTAELCKYMENCFLATKVAFVNQFYEIATTLGVSFSELRRLWLLDPRVGSSHTEVTPERGFGGRCLPKDLSAIVAAMRDKGGAPLLEAVLSYNTSIRKAKTT